MLTPSIDINTIFLFLILLGAFAVFLVTLGFVAFTFFKFRGREQVSIDSVLLQVAVPRGNEIKIDAMEQLFASLASIKKGGFWQKFSIQPAISFEIVAKPEDIRFYVWAPKRLQDLVEKQIHGAYPDAEIVEIQEYNIFSEQGKVAYKSLQLKKSNFYPIKIFKDLPTDPLASLTSALAKMGANEACAIQILVSPADSSWQGAGASFISETKKQEPAPEKAKYATSAKTLEAVEAKIGKPGFEASIRIVCVAPTEEAAKAHLANIEGAFDQFASEHNSFGKRKIRSKGSFMEDFLYRYQPMFHLLGSRPSVLNTEELATLFHFPNKAVTTPHIQWIYSKTAPPPSEVASEGLYLGMSAYRGIRRPVHMIEDDRRRHMYIIGKTGTGKTELLKDLIMLVIRAGKGICYMDPHGA